ncbi:MAG TPA: DUF1549 domain-containing protein [Pirellulaceae bacterium]|nr:DUF1549 domain-containing protein [Pirellulaceae bacterium]
MLRQFTKVGRNKSSQFRHESSVAKLPEPRNALFRPTLLATAFLVVATSASAGELSPRSYNFENDIVPILSKFGCNTSGCHGKAEGQNGFKLSVFGFDPEQDYRALTMEGRGRRVFPAAPQRSLMLLKASGGIPHGGGIRMDPSRPELETLVSWIKAGAPFGSPTDPKAVSIKVTPNEGQLTMHASQPLHVEATWSDGRKLDVTRLATYQSNNDSLATVDEDGVVTIGEAAGGVAVMAAYLGHVDVFQAIVPRGEQIENYPTVAEANFIDRPIHDRLKKLNILPSAECDDATYLRRVYLDIIGTLPTAEEARRFIADTRSDKRALLVDQLLRRPEYADYWALKWADLLRVDRLKLGHKRAYVYYQWIHDSFAANKPFDRFTTELVAADGPLLDSPAGQFYKAVDKPNEMASTISQVFLGVRIECAQCHHHPYDRWTQTDYYGMQAFFTQVAFKASPRGEVLISSGSAKTNHPRTGEEVLAHALLQPLPQETPEGDRRKLLAAWMTSRDNPWFARNLANRYWAHFMGRGLVEPVDDFRFANPPSNPQLLDELATHLAASNFDLQELIRTIVASKAYQRSSHPNYTNQLDELNYSRYLFKRLDAEVLFDAVCQTTGVGEKFSGVPNGSRAIQLWDSQVPHYFLTLFGRPMRATACDCERVAEPTTAQVLHVLNSPEIQRKLSHSGGRLARLLADIPSDDMLAEELYLTCFNRVPTDAEKQVATVYLTEHDSRRQAAEDLVWSMMNSLEFLFNH